MRRLTVVAALTGISSVCAAPGAQENPNVVKLAPTLTVAAAASRLAASSGALVAVDPTIEGKVPASFAEGNLEAGLRRIADLRRLQYRKLYLDAAAVPKVANEGIDAAKLKAWAMALDALGSANVGVEKGGTLSVIGHQPVSSAETQAWMKGRTVVHVLYRPEEAVAGTRAPRDASADGRLPEPIDTTGMSPEQIAEAYKAGKPVALDFATARKLKEMYPGLLPDIKMDLPEGANGRIVLMRKDDSGGGQRRIEVTGDVFQVVPPPR